MVVQVLIDARGAPVFPVTPIVSSVLEATTTPRTAFISTTPTLPLKPTGADRPLKLTRGILRIQLGRIPASSREIHTIEDQSPSAELTRLDSAMSVAARRRRP